MKYAKRQAAGCGRGTPCPSGRATPRVHGGTHPAHPAHRTREPGHAGGAGRTGAHRNHGAHGQFARHGRYARHGERVGESAARQADAVRRCRAERCVSGGYQG